MTPTVATCHARGRSEAIRATPHGIVRAILGVIALRRPANDTVSVPSSLKGRISTKFGPMRAAFGGTPALERDEADKRGAIRGNGTDNLSGSRARGGLVKEFVRKMVADFAANLNARLGVPAGAAAPAPAPVAQVDAGGVFWRWLWGSIRRLFGGK